MWYFILDMIWQIVVCWLLPKCWSKVILWSSNQDELFKLIVASRYEHAADWWGHAGTRAQAQHLHLHVPISLPCSRQRRVWLCTCSCRCTWSRLRTGLSYKRTTGIRRAAEVAGHLVCGRGNVASRGGTRACFDTTRGDVARRSVRRLVGVRGVSRRCCRALVAATWCSGVGKHRMEWYGRCDHAIMGRRVRLGLAWSGRDTTCTRAGDEDSRNVICLWFELGHPTKIQCVRKSSPWPNNVQESTGQDSSCRKLLPWFKRKIHSLFNELNGFKFNQICKRLLVFMILNKYYY